MVFEKLETYLLYYHVFHVLRLKSLINGVIIMHHIINTTHLYSAITLNALLNINMLDNIKSYIPLNKAKM